MSTESNSVDPYEAVLADLRAKRDQIDQAIAVIANLRSGAGGTVGAATMQSAGAVGADQGIVETAGMYLGMSIVDAAKKLLALRKRTMGNVEIARELQAGGLALNSVDPVNTIGSVLTRRFNQVGDVVKLGRGIWGLKEWYPNRTFKPATKNAPVAEATADGGDESAQPAPDTVEGNEDEDHLG